MVNWLAKRLPTLRRKAGASHCSRLTMAEEDVRGGCRTWLGCRRETASERIAPDHGDISDCDWSQRLLIENVATGLGRAQIEEYPARFAEDLIWLVLGFGAGTATGGGSPIDSELARCSARLQPPPGGSLNARNDDPRNDGRNADRESSPNAATFRQLARMPSATRLVGRGAEKTATSPTTAICAIWCSCERLGKASCCRE